VEGHDLAVRGEAEVRLDGVRALLASQAKGGESILRRIMRSAAVGDDFWEVDGREIEG